MRHFALLAILLTAASCSSKIGNSQEGAADARPIDFRDPPEPKEGSGTAAGCEGVTARGECQQGSAVYCDLDRGRLRRVDCEALGQNCILDISRGAVCKSLEEQDTGAGSGSASACSDTGISETGFCTTGGSAVYCDTSGAEPVTRSWDCGSVGKTCAVDGCAEGAFCCGEGDSSGGEDLCAESGLDFDGICDGDVAKWCDDASGPGELDCGLFGQRCEVDTCANGAFCCGDIDFTGGMSEQEECAAIGFDGICTDNSTVRFCSLGTIQEVTCTGTRTCQVDECIPGAGCCEPAAAPTNECEEIGIDGVCDDADTLRYCLGDAEEDIVVETCGEGFSCQVDEFDFAECVETVDPCANLDSDGICADDFTLQYCIGGNFTEIDCLLQSGGLCEVDETGFADCI